MPRGKKGPRPDELLKQGAREKLNKMLHEDGQTTIEETWLCIYCDFKTTALNYLEQHHKSAGHGVYGIPTPPPDGLAEPATAEQSELFKEPGIVKWLTVPLSAEVVNEKRQALAELYQQGLDVMDAKKTADKDFNAQLATIETMMRGIAKTLAAPTEEAEVACEWRVIDGENARGLYRLDTGECMEKAALTAEDRAAELDQAQDMNEVPF